MGLRKILFLDRDGTLIAEPEDEQIDRLDKLQLIDHVIPSLLRLRDAGFEFVLVSNQDGLGTEGFPQAAFDAPHQMMLQILNSQGIEFIAEHIDDSFPEANSINRKPNIGMLVGYLNSGDLDAIHSYVIGDRDTDLELAINMGIQGFRLGPGFLSWPEICRAILDRPRTASVKRTTSETRIDVAVDLDTPTQNGPEASQFSTGIGFFDHMLEQVSRHSGIGIQLSCQGDLHVDAHHTIEDVGLALGEAIDKALGDRRGIGRYGFLLPMDESLADVAIDLSGRPCLVFDGAFGPSPLGEFPTEMIRHFFQSFSQSLRAALHITVRGDNDHHKCEAIFKGLGRALGQAVARQASTAIPSTKGVL